MKNTFKQTIKNVFLNLKRMLGVAYSADKFLTVGYFASAGIAAFFPIAASYVYKLLIDTVIANQKISPTIPFVLIAVLGIRYVSNWCWDFVSWALKETYFDYLLRYKLQNKLNSLFCEKLSNIDIEHLENAQTQDLITKAKDTLTWRPPDFLRAFSYLFNNLISFVSTFLLLMNYGIAMPFVIALFGIPRLYLRAKLGSLQWSIWGSGAPQVRKLWYLQWILTTKESIVESRIFQSGKALMDKYVSIQEELYEKNKKPVKSFLFRSSLPQIFEGAVMLYFSIILLPQVLHGSMSVGDYSFYIELLSRLTSSVGGMVGNLGWMYENNLYVNHFFEVLGLSKLVREKDDAVEVPDTSNPPVVEFKNVSFSYPGSNKKALDNVSFVLNSKENLALVGKNGSGKTTIVKLLCRFYDVTEGEILINGVNIKDVKLSSWYKYLGTLFQEFMHYDFSIKENITLGNEADCDEDRLLDSAKKSGAYDFIKKFPTKFEQQLGKEFEDGTELSQGQWQKLAIARAFYECAPILILDEPTSAIDAESEYEIFNNLHNHYQDKSLLFISHRFSTVKSADKIIVLNDGVILESGSHASLMKKNGEYQKLFTLQAQAYKD